MKFFTAATIILSAAHTSEAIYLACCETTQACPQYYNTIESYVKGEDTFNACCYQDETPNLADLPECVHPIMTEDGVGISLMTLPQSKLEPGNETELVEEITITEGNEEIVITAEILSAAGPATPEEATSASAYSCCAVASTVQPALRSSSGSSACPEDMQSVEGLTFDLSFLDGAKTNAQVCCDAKNQPDEINLELVLPCPNQVTTQEDIAEDMTSQEENVADANAANALNADAESSSASGIHSVAFGIAAFCVVLQIVL
jgi:hypothetical protein